MAAEKKREKLRRDVLVAWENYKRTGLHATFEEVDAWLERLEKGEDVLPPTPHT
jgi:hypothetical protein